jgi:hypothetical protein
VGIRPSDSFSLNNHASIVFGIPIVQGLERATVRVRYSIPTVRGAPVGSAVVDVPVLVNLAKRFDVTRRTACGRPVDGLIVLSGGEVNHTKGRGVGALHNGFTEKDVLPVLSKTTSDVLKRRRIGRVDALPTQERKERYLPFVNLIANARLSLSGYDKRPAACYKGQAANRLKE